MMIWGIYEKIIGLTKDNRYERVLSDVEAIDIEKDSNIGFRFVIKHKNGAVEKTKYKFYRISFIEQAQYNRLKKQINRMVKEFIWWKNLFL